MSTDSNEAPRQLPARPNLHHLKNQAKDLLKVGGAASLSEAQFATARQYGFPSWPKLKKRVEWLEELHGAADVRDTERSARSSTMKRRVSSRPAMRHRSMTPSFRSRNSSA